MEAGEDALAAAQRELLEQTGIRARERRDCGNFSPNPAAYTNRFHVFACRVLSTEPPGRTRRRISGMNSSHEIC